MAAHPNPPNHPAEQRFPACEWHRDRGHDLAPALDAFAAWLLQQHRAAHGAAAPAADIVLVFHYAPFAATLLALALERAGAALPPVRVADSCLLAKYALSQLQAPAPAAVSRAAQQGRWLDRVGGVPAEGGDEEVEDEGGAPPPRPHLRHDCRLDRLLQRAAPAWLALAPWFRRFDALSDARSALVLTQALSQEAWGGPDEWRAFALGTSCRLTDAFGRAGRPRAAALVQGWRDGA
jgi:hypothetical protein